MVVGGLAVWRSGLAGRQLGRPSAVPSLVRYSHARLRHKPLACCVATRVPSDTAAQINGERELNCTLSLAVSRVSIGGLSSPLLPGLRQTTLHGFRLCREERKRESFLFFFSLFLLRARRKSVWQTAVVRTRIRDRCFERFIHAYA